MKSQRSWKDVEEIECRILDEMAYKKKMRCRIVDRSRGVSSVKDVVMVDEVVMNENSHIRRAYSNHRYTVVEPNNGCHLRDENISGTRYTVLVID